MSSTHTRRGLTVAALSTALVTSLAATAVAQDEKVELTMLADNTEGTMAWTEALVAAYEEQNPNVSISVEWRPGGGDGDNIVKTRLATGEMADIFRYNSGSLFQALNPTETLVDLSGEAFMENVSDAFLPSVTAGDGVYGVPLGTAMGGGILYNKAIYEELGLEVPTTWEEFAANNEAIKEAGIAPVAASFADTWTSQLFVLSDFYNVLAADPEWAEKYTANQAKYATDPAALKGFQYTQQGFDDGWWQEDFDVTTYGEAVGLLSEGEVAHYPMLTFALGEISNVYPEAVDDIGFFAQPGTAEANGATIWMTDGTYIPNTSENIDAAKDFLAYIASVEATEVMSEAQSPAGPYLIDGATLPEDAMPALFDLQAYIDAGNAAPALEFLSPIKGPQLEHILVEVGSGLRSAEDGAALYDQDVVKQAQQVGLEGWDE
jgi:raffinose/stachyose/melibiose transport system substrate-binding protein